MLTMNEGIKLLLLSMLVSFSIGTICSNNGGCSCQEVDILAWKIQCPSDSNPKFIVHLSRHEHLCRIECHDATSWPELGYRPTFPLSCLRMRALAIERCPLLDEFFDHIGLESVKFFRFTSQMNLSSTLTRRHLSMLSTLQNLNLSSNGLTELPSDLFRSRGSVDSLDLSYNKIAMLPYDIFHGLSELWEIHLGYNVMMFLDWRLFVNCTSLTWICLRGNLLTSLDHNTFRNIQHDSYYTTINLADNLLETLQSETFESAETLSLDISGNRFSTLPEELFSRTELTKLEFGHNRGNLTTLPMNLLSNSTTLTKVVLIQNNLTSLPENIFWGSLSVQSIDLHGNTLSELPKNIFKDSRKLIFLDLSDNGLTYLPEGLFHALGELLWLNIARNGITSLSKNIFENLDALLELNLEINNIADIHSATFSNLPRIQIIRLSHNSVGQTQQRWPNSIGEYFDGWTIQKIFLDHNNLTGVIILDDFFNSKPFAGNLQLVDLTYNQIACVSVFNSRIISQYRSYEFGPKKLPRIMPADGNSPKLSILVDNNPLRCDCDIYETLKYVHGNRRQQSESNVEIILGNASCSGPYWMLKTPIDSLRLETFTCRPRDDYLDVPCADGCDCWWRPHDETRIVDCSARNFRETPDKVIKSFNEDKNANLWWFTDHRTRLFYWRHTPIELNLVNNSLREISTLNGSEYKSVESLLLSRNSVSRLSFDVLPPRLKMLHLDHNDLRTLNATSVEAMMNSLSLRKVNLERNPWNCDGDTRNSLALLEKKFGKNVQYSFDMRTCLDSRQATGSKTNDRLYISFTRF